MFSYPELVERAESLSIAASGVKLDGELLDDGDATGLVVLPRVSGEPVGPRLHYFAWLIRQAGFATALVDLAVRSDRTAGGEVATDAAHLAERLSAWTDALQRRPEFAPLPIGYLAAGVAANAALIAAAQPGCPARTVACYGGRADVPTAVLERVAVPVLFIAPGNDAHALRTCRHALAQLRCHKRMDVIPGAHHLFEEAGALCRVALRARRWLRRQLRAPAPLPLALLPAPRAVETTGVPRSPA